MIKNLIYYDNIIKKASRANSNIREDFIFFLKEKLNFKDRDIYLIKEKTLTDNEDALINDFIEKKQQGIPLAYILNSSKFYDQEFYVDERVLIPRPETELLVDFIIEQDFSKIKILDAGTGSGCIGISLALKNPTLELYGSDFSMDSLNVAKINKNNLKADNFYLIHADWLSCFKEKSFDLIVSNPPYIGKKDPHLTNLTFEPSHALIATQNGFGDIKKIIKHSTKILKKKGILLLEHGFDQSNEIKKTLVEYGFSSIHTIKDYQDHQRVTFGTL